MIPARKLGALRNQGLMRSRSNNCRCLSAIACGLQVHGVRPWIGIVEDAQGGVTQSRRRARQLAPLLGAPHRLDNPSGHTSNSSAMATVLPRDAGEGP